MSLVKVKLFRWALNQYDWCPYKRKKFGHKDRYTTTEEKHHVEMKAEIEVMHLQAKDCQILLANHQKQEEKYGTDFSS